MFFCFDHSRHYPDLVMTTMVISFFLLIAVTLEKFSRGFVKAVRARNISTKRELVAALLRDDIEIEEAFDRFPKVFDLRAAFGSCSDCRSSIWEKG